MSLCPPSLVVAEEGIVLEVLVGCHGCYDEKALEGGRGQVDTWASLLEAFEIDESGYAAARAATADFRNPLDKNRRLEFSSPSVKTAERRCGACFSLAKSKISHLKQI
jgi:hypothetical protein